MSVLAVGLCIYEESSQIETYNLTVFGILMAHTLEELLPLAASSAPSPLLKSCAHYALAI